MRSRRVIALLSAVVAVNFVLWAAPSDVVELIARDRQTLLGRYSRRHFAWNLALAPVSAVVLVIGLAGDPCVRRRRVWQVGGVALAVVPVTCATDLVLRTRAPVYYIRDTLAYHRPPEVTYQELLEDIPEAKRTYPEVKPGFASIGGTLRTDKRGYRNPTTLDRCDIVALGDSFTEGSKVSDEHPWPVRLAARSGLSVCNLGMSGYAPQHYLAALTQYGLGLHPRLVICVLYEENDFRSVKVTTEPKSERGKFLKRSPLLQMLDAVIVRTFAPVGATGPVKGGDILSWLPLRVPDTPAGKYYAFSPGLMLDLYHTREEFSAEGRWEAVRRNLQKMRDRCQEIGARFVLVYAPSKPHVLLPLVAPTLPPQKIRAFAALRAKEDLPDAGEFLRSLMARLDVKERLTEEWCRALSISFLSLTPILRESVARGDQVYFTYNDHWTPVGHDAVAEAVFRFLCKVQR